jgi:Arm DNA-binding domain/Phage integrase family
MPTKTPAKAAPNRAKFTQILCERMRPPADGYLTVWDTGLPGFGLRISSKGRRSWICMYRVAGGKEVMETLGTMSLIPSVAEARDRARRSMDAARSGIHPVKQRKQKQAAEQAAAEEQAYKLEQMVEDYVCRHHRESRPSTIREARRLCRRALPYLGDKPVKQIVKADVLAAINALAQTRLNTWRGNTGPALVEASGVLRHLRSMFRWALDEDLVERDPTQGVRPPVGKRERDRVLSDPEIKALWQVCEEIGFPFGPLVQLLLLTAQREKEVGDLPWREIKGRVWTLPGARAKNHCAHDIHLSDLAMEVINKIPKFAGDGPGFVFSVDGTRPVQSYSDAKGRIDKRLTELLGNNVEPWVLHDLRRTATTGMARLKIPPHIADKVLNHQHGTISGIAGIYNKFQYLDEREDALDVWGKFVEALVYPDRAGTNIVPMRAPQTA